MPGQPAPAIVDHDLQDGDQSVAFGWRRGWPPGQSGRHAVTVPQQNWGSVNDLAQRDQLGQLPCLERAHAHLPSGAPERGRRGGSGSLPLALTRITTGLASSTVSVIIGPVATILVGLGQVGYGLLDKLHDGGRHGLGRIARQAPGPW